MKTKKIISIELSICLLMSFAVNEPAEADQTVPTIVSGVGEVVTTINLKKGWNVLDNKSKEALCGNKIEDIFNMLNRQSLLVESVDYFENAIHRQYGQMPNQSSKYVGKLKTSCVESEDVLSIYSNGNVKVNIYKNAEYNPVYAPLEEREIILKADTYTEIPKYPFLGKNKHEILRFLNNITGENTYYESGHASHSGENISIDDEIYDDYFCDMIIDIDNPRSYALISNDSTIKIYSTEKDTSILIPRAPSLLSAQCQNGKIVAKVDPLPTNCDNCSENNKIQYLIRIFAKYPNVENPQLIKTITLEDGQSDIEYSDLPEEEVSYYTVRSGYVIKDVNGSVIANENSLNAPLQQKKIRACKDVIDVTQDEVYVKNLKITNIIQDYESACSEENWGMISRCTSENKKSLCVCMQLKDEWKWSFIDNQFINTNTYPSF